jgi:hypothetical protein
VHYEERLIVSSGRILGYSQSAVAKRKADIASAIQRRVAALGDDEVLSLDPEAWAGEVAGDLAIVPPKPRPDGMEAVPHGRVRIDCTGLPGISFTALEGTGVVRDGDKVTVSVPVDGDVGLLASRTSAGGHGFKVDLAADCVERTYQWPHVLGAEAMREDVHRFLAGLAQGASLIADEVAAINGSLKQQALKALAVRREAIEASQDFTSKLRLPFRPAAEAPRPIPMPKRIDPPVAMARAPRQAAADPASGIVLDDFYKHVVHVLRSAARGLERTPGWFATAEEEALRDHLLVTLNTHYEGAATGETFNARGKTDILVRFENHNVFIGECKIWGGRRVLDGALTQLLSYATWRDTRLALVLFVRRKGLSAVIETTREALASRPEFAGWSKLRDGQGVLRCQLAGAGGHDRRQVLTVFFVHLHQTAIP